MTEATHTSEAMYSLGRGIGRGPKLWAAYIQAGDGETVDTGLDTIEGIGHMKGSTPADEFIVAESISGGVITIGTGKYSSPSSASAADVDVYMIVVGSKR